ncbi:MAG: flagellar basal body-associated FliL family protein [Parvularculaceae bacterium]
MEPIETIDHADERAPGPASGPRARARVRTPGKHITLFFIAASLMLSISTLAFNDQVRRRIGASSLSTFANGEARYVRLEPVLVDLAPDLQGRRAYAKLTPVVVVADRDAERAVAARQAEIRERMSFLMRQLSPEDLSGAPAMARVKDELLRRVDVAIAPAKAQEVVVDDLIVQ